MTPTIFLVDDDLAVLKAISRILRSVGLTVSAFSSPQEFLDDHDGDAPGCAVLDLSMPGINGIELQEALSARGSALPIIFLTGHGDVPTTAKAMKGGAIDFLTKPVNDKDLLAAVNRALIANRDARLDRARRSEVRRRFAELTPREYEVMLHVVTGKLNKQVAAELGTAEKTIKVHRARVMQKTNVQSLAELVLLVERAGITSQP